MMTPEKRKAAIELARKLLSLGAPVSSADASLVMGDWIDGPFFGLVGEMTIQVVQLPSGTLVPLSMVSQASRSRVLGTTAADGEITSVLGISHGFQHGTAPAVSLGVGSPLSPTSREMVSRGSSNRSPK